MHRVYLLILIPFFLSPNTLVAEERIISLGPNITEVFFDMACDNYLVGVTNECPLPTYNVTIQRIGSFGSPDIEKIVALKPTHILAPYSNHPSLIKLGALGIPIHIVPCGTIDQLKNLYSMIGEITGQKRIAQRKVASLEIGLKNIARTVPTDMMPKVYFEIWGDPLITVSKGSFIHDAIKMMGGYNIAQELPKAYPKIQSEYVVTNNPAIIILAYDTQEELSKRPGWQYVSAVKNKQIYKLKDPNKLLRLGPNIIDGLGELRDLIYKPYAAKKEKTVTENAIISK